MSVAKSLNFIAVAGFLLCPQVHAALPNDNYMFKVGYYFTGSQIVQYMVYDALDYCTKINPTLKNSSEEAKNSWNKRNLATATSWKNIVVNIMAEQGIDQITIASNIAEIENAEKTEGFFKKNAEKNVEDFRKLLNDRDQDGKKAMCQTAIEEISNGNADIQKIKPDIYELYIKYKNPPSPAKTQKAP